MGWYPQLESFAGIKVGHGHVIDRHVIDRRDISPLLRGKSDLVPSPMQKLSLDASVSLGRPWNPGSEWTKITSHDEFGE